MYLKKLILKNIINLIVNRKIQTKFKIMKKFYGNPSLKYEEI